MSIFVEFALPVTAFPPERRLPLGDGVSLELDRVVPTGSVTHYLWIAGAERRRAVDALEEDPAVSGLTVLDELADRLLVRVVWERDEAAVFQLVEETGAVLVAAEGADDEWTITLRFPDQEALSAFYDASRERGVSLELRGINEAGFGADDARYGLTAVQWKTLDAAFEAGYFDVPRQVTLAELSARLDVSEQAVSERLRRAVGALVERTLFGPSGRPHR